MTNIKNAVGERIAGPDPAPAELLDVHAVAAMVDASSRYVRRLSDAGLMPAPVKLGALVRWPRQAVMDWISRGCPSVRNTKKAQN